MSCKPTSAAKIEAVAFIIPVGILLVTFGVIALKAERGGFAWGVAVPCLLFGLVAIGIGTGIAVRTAGQVAEITRGYEEAPTEMLAKELPRMQKVKCQLQVYLRRLRPGGRGRSGPYFPLPHRLGQGAGTRVDPRGSHRLPDRWIRRAQGGTLRVGASGACEAAPDSPG